MDKSEIESGGTYCTDSGDLYRVEEKSGQRLTLRLVNDGVEARETFACSLGRFASRATERR